MTAIDDKAFLRALGLRVRVLRTAAEMTQERLAAACGLSTSAIVHLEQGRTAPNILTLRWVAEALDVAVSDVVAADDGPLRLRFVTGSDSGPAPRRR